MDYFSDVFGAHLSRELAGFDQVILSDIQVPGVCVNYMCSSSHPLRKVQMLLLLQCL